jgi:hypothetical protein
VVDSFLIFLPFVFCSFGWLVGFGFLRQCLAMYVRLASNSWFFCLHLPKYWDLILFL